MNNVIDAFGTANIISNHPSIFLVSFEMTIRKIMKKAKHVIIDNPL